jgi:hypothetical protein
LHAALLLSGETWNAYMESRRKVAEERCGILLKALLCVVEENAAETAGRTPDSKDEERTVKSSTERRTRIDARKGRKEGTRNTSEGTGRWGARSACRS